MNKIQHTIYIKKILKLKNIPINEDTIEDCIDWAQWIDLHDIDINHPSEIQLNKLANDYYEDRGRYLK